MNDKMVRLTDCCTESTDFKKDNPESVQWNAMEINSNKIIIIKTIVGFIIKKCNSKLLFIFSTKTYGLGTQKNHLNGKVLLSTQNNSKN